MLFMRELYGKFHPLGLQVTQCVPLYDQLFDVKKLAKHCDHLILMAYDEHVPNFTSAGPIASQKWFEEGVALRKTQIGGGKIIVALGGYAYDWKGDSIIGTSSTVQEAKIIASRTKSQIIFDEESQNPTFDYRDEKDEIRHVWFLNAKTFSNEINATRGDVYGYALWRLGSEDRSIWKIFRE